MLPRRQFLGAIALVAAAITLVIGLRWLATPAIAPHDRTVAVLAFTSGVPPQRTAQTDSLRRAIIRAIASLPGIQLVGDDRPLDSAMLALRPREVGATLGARLVVSGVSNETGQLEVRLIEVEVGDNLYTESVSLSSDPTTVADRIARGIAKALRLPVPQGITPAAGAGPAPPRQSD